MQTNQNNQPLINLKGQNLKKEINRSGYTKEQVVAYVQDQGHRFSMAGLDRLYRGELVKDAEDILKAIAAKIGCPFLNFLDEEKMTA